MKTDKVSRYHPALVTLHWLLALFIIGALAIGFLVLGDMPNSDPHKIALLQAHMLGGTLILLLMVIRFVVRLWTARPPDATTGYPLLDKLAPVTHYGFYLVVVLMVGTGIATARISGLPQIVFGHSGAPLPADFEVYPTFLAHGTLALILVGLIALHFAAALYHQFVRKDGLFRRMFFGPRAATPPTAAE